MYSRKSNTLTMTSRRPRKRLLMQGLVLAGLAWLAPFAAQAQNATVTDKPTLGRITLINRTYNCSPYATRSTLYLIPNNIFSFSVGYKIEDNSRGAIYNNRATAEVYRWRFGEPKPTKIWSAKVQKNYKTPWKTYKVTAPSWESSDGIGLIPQKYFLMMDGQRGRFENNPPCNTGYFAVAQNPKAGGELLAVTLVANESAREMYQEFSNRMTNLTAGEGANWKNEGFSRVWRAAYGFVETWSTYFDVSAKKLWLHLALDEIEASYGDKINESILSPVMKALRDKDAVGELEAVAERVIEEAMAYLNDSKFRGDLKLVMPSGKKYLENRNVCIDPRTKAESLRAALQDYGYKGLHGSTFVAKLNSAIAALEGYVSCLKEAHDVFDKHVDKLPNVMSEKCDLKDFGEKLFSFQQANVLLHLAELESLRLQLCDRNKYASCSTSQGQTAGTTEPDANVHIDYTDDLLVKHFYIDGSQLLTCAAQSGEFLWDLRAHAKAFRSHHPGKEGIEVLVNDQKICEFWPQKQGFSTAQYSTKVGCAGTGNVKREGNRYVLSGPFRNGKNTVKLRTRSHWDYNGILVGIDRSRDRDESAWDNKRNANPQPVHSQGELMITMGVWPVR